MTLPRRLVGAACASPQACGLLSLVLVGVLWLVLRGWLGVSSICLFRLPGWEFCWGCGMGSALAALAAGDWWLALERHPLSPVVGGAIAFLLVGAARDVWRRVLQDA